MCRTVVHRERNDSNVTPALVQSEVLDALASADLGDLPSARGLLTLDYLKNAGSDDTFAKS